MGAGTNAIDQLKVQLVMNGTVLISKAMTGVATDSSRPTESRLRKWYAFCFEDDGGEGNGIAKGLRNMCRIADWSTARVEMPCVARLLEHLGVVVVAKKIESLPEFLGKPQTSCLKRSCGVEL